MNASILFLNAKTFVQKLCGEVLSFSKRPDISAKYANFPTTTHPTKNLLKGNLFFSTRFLLIEEFKKTSKNLQNEKCFYITKLFITRSNLRRNNQKGNKLMVTERLTIEQLHGIHEIGI